ncbi:hypothetical protein [Paenarthrobacter sp. PH39-S1]|uniref:hypothetical protein n=1 Tax=Paenarthrobacter sp. PH39-S1 TaxID=3046204 RepID=UPI0024BA72FF|nr:hypothetical protein [Paenarthrobacter sp. PH39-S1]MDJ0355048.1 hypothetical protein [Paenarthrobacter sp. PH39-S1]
MTLFRSRRQPLTEGVTATLRERSRHRPIDRIFLSNVLQQQDLSFDGCSADGHECLLEAITAHDETAAVDSVDRNQSSCMAWPRSC